MNTPTTLVIGASPDTSRYSNMCIRELSKRKFPVKALGLRDGVIDGIEILKGRPNLEGIHTVSLYIGPGVQPQYVDYILELKPRRVIFNPGTENPEFENRLESEGIEVLAACSLVMLHAGLFFEN